MIRKKSAITISILALILLGAVLAVTMLDNFTSTVQAKASLPSASAITTSLIVTTSSTGNACFVNGYNAQIPVINVIYWECGATLQGGQTIKQNLFLSSELFGSFTLTVTASNPLTLKVFENGVKVYSQKGTSISWSGSINQNEPLHITIKNSEASSSTTYQLAIDWTRV